MNAHPAALPRAGSQPEFREVLMFRLWGKCIRNNHPVRDIVVCDGDYSKSRTRMVLDGLTGICRAFDLAEPIWLAKPMILIIWKYG